MIECVSETGAGKQSERELYTRAYTRIYAQIPYDRFVLELGDSIGTICDLLLSLEDGLCYCQELL